MAALRHAKAKASLLIALADLGEVWSVDEVTAALTRFADAMLGATVNWLLLDATRAGKFRCIDRERSSRHCGYVVLAMGKHGAGELNYSSDIDLIILYDPETAPMAEGVEPATFFVRLTKRLVTILQDVTEDGYGFRVDLRLRPDPRATQVAIALEAAANYYESMGQNWERAAMIKARAAAGDIGAGRGISCCACKPYIWRKYLDFAAIADVQSLKRQIHAVKGHGAIAVHGHNIKLGRGGIREIEFFVQTQQLIAGGRNPALRGLRTLEMLDALAEAKWISRKRCRRIEGGLPLHAQHRAPHPDGERRANPCPAAGRAGLRKSRALCPALHRRRTSKQNCARLLNWCRATTPRSLKVPANLAPTPAAWFSPVARTIPKPLKPWSAWASSGPSEVSATIRGWHFGRYAATRSGKSKELLTELMPQLLAGAGAQRRSRPGLPRLRQVHRRASRRGSAFFHAEGQSQPA